MTKIWHKRFRPTDKTVYYTVKPPSKRLYIVDPNGGVNPEGSAKMLQDAYDDPDVEYVDKVNEYPILEITKNVYEEKVELPSGSYVLEFNDRDGSSALCEMPFRSDHYVNLNDITSDIEKDLKEFIGAADLYKNLNTVHKTGLLLYGPPGEGKTSLIRNLVNSNPSFKDAIIINIKMSFPRIPFLKALNESTQGRLKIFIFEELTMLVNEQSESESVLSFLDGESSVNNSITIATTNYPHRLPQNIVNRPGRFDKIYKINSPDAEARRLLLTHFYGQSPNEAELAITAGYSTAFLKEICMIAKIKHTSIEAAVAKIRAMFAAVKDDFKDSKMGF